MHDAPIEESTHIDDRTPVRATVNLAAIRHNARVLQERAEGAQLMAVIKADAYGHGALPVARVLHEEGVRHFGVARLEEGVRLREKGITDRILLLGAPFPEQIPQYAEHDLDVTVSSTDGAVAVARHARPDAPVRAHVKVDTGMGRLGLAPTDVSAVVSHLSECRGVVLAGLWTHFATADEPDSPFARAQMDEFERVLDEVNVPVEHVHAANTGALLTIGARAHNFEAPLVRTGIALYGLGANPELGARMNVRPAMQLTARVTHLKTVSAGTPISYGAHWTAERRTRIATLGTGYGDGYPARCSGKASVRIGNAMRPVVGSICMDMCMVDLGPPEETLASSVEIGDEAVFFGPGSPTVYDVAEWADTNPYEICTRVSPRVPRHYVDRKQESEAYSVSSDIGGTPLR